MIDAVRIELCGEIGAGKTTLASLLELNGYCVLYDRFSNNPFWNNLYEQPEGKNLFESEICFSMLHYNSVRNNNSKVTICDWSVYQDLSYATVNLSEREYKAFADLYNYVLQDIGYPEIVVYLRCPVDMLLARISSRNRKQDKWITKDYLENCIAKLEQSLSKAKNIIIIESDKMDFTQFGQQKDTVLKLIQEAIVEIKR